MQQLPHAVRRRAVRPALLTAAAVGVLAMPAAALASGLSVKLHAPGHAMPIHKAWRYTVDVRYKGRPARGKIRYEFANATLGTVYTQKWQKLSKGVYHGTMRPWTNPQTHLAEGLPLTLVVEVKTAAGRDSVRYPITIKP